MKLLALGFLLAASSPSLDTLLKQVEQDPKGVERLFAWVGLGVDDRREARACAGAFRWALDQGPRRLGTGRKEQVLAARGLWRADRDGCLDLLGGQDDQRSALAADAIEEEGKGDPRALAWVHEEGLRHAKARVRAQCASLLGRVRERKAASVLATLLASDPDEEVREMCARALSRAGGDAQAGALAQAAEKDKSKRVRKASTLALGWLATRDCGDALIGLAKGSEDPPGTRDALELLTGSRDLKEAEAKWAKARGYPIGPEEAQTPHGRSKPEEVEYSTKRKRRSERHRVLYVFDCSGSIPDPKSQQAAYAGRILALPEDTMFDLIAFSVVVCPWNGILAEADFRNRRKASDWIRCFDGRSGSTPLSSAVRKALVDYDVDEVVLFTDGGGNTGVTGKDLFSFIQAVNVCRRVRLRGVPVGNLDRKYGGGGTSGEALIRLVEESGGIVE